nr:elongation factor P-like [Ipomoea batatas]
MRLLTSRLRQALYSSAAASYLPTSFAPRGGFSRALTTCIHSSPSLHSLNNSESLLKPHRFLAFPWSATQLRGVKLRGADVELRDVDSGNKVNERFRTDEAVERVFAEEKPFTYLYTDDETGNIVLMEPNTYAQLDVPKHLFGDSYVFLQDDMRVCVQLYDERPMSASIPTRVTCTVAETPIQVKGASVTPQYKKAVLDNGVTVQVPGHILPGDKIIINTTDNSYMSKA